MKSVVPLSKSADAVIRNAKNPIVRSKHVWQNKSANVATKNVKKLTVRSKHVRRNKTVKNKSVNFAIRNARRRTIRRKPVVTPNGEPRAIALSRLGGTRSARWKRIEDANTKSPNDRVVRLSEMSPARSNPRPGDRLQALSWLQVPALLWLAETQSNVIAMMTTTPGKRSVPHILTILHDPIRHAADHRMHRPDMPPWNTRLI
jgi:hypothetical protein